MRHELDIDLYEYVRGDRPWAQMYRFLARLPRHGHFYASVLADEESMEQVLSQEDNAESKSAIPLAGWTTDHDLLTTVIDVLNSLHATLVQVNSEKGQRPDVKPMPRPETAIERVEAKQAIDEHLERVRKFLGK